MVLRQKRNILLNEYFILYTAQISLVYVTLRIIFEKSNANWFIHKDFEYLIVKF